MIVIKIKYFLVLLALVLVVSACNTSQFQKLDLNNSYYQLTFGKNVPLKLKQQAKSVFAKNQQTIGIGAGQMSRVISAAIANMKAQEENLIVENACMASDAFFPFRDGIDTAAASGITAIIQPGGSMRDDEVIAAADEHDIAMVFTGMRHFRH